MDYNSKISVTALNNLLKRLNNGAFPKFEDGGNSSTGIWDTNPYSSYLENLEDNLRVPKFANGGGPENPDPYTADLMSRATQNPKSLSRQEKRYLKDLGFFPGFDEYTPTRDTTVYGDMLGSSDLTWALSDTPTNPYTSGNPLMISPNMGGVGTPFNRQLVQDPNAADPYAQHLMSLDPKSLTRQDRKYLDYAMATGNVGSTGAPSGTENPLMRGLKAGDVVSYEDVINSGGTVLNPSRNRGYNPFKDPTLSDEEYEKMMRSGKKPSKPTGVYNSIAEITSDMENDTLTEEEGALLIDQFNEQGFANKTASDDGDEGANRFASAWQQAMALGLPYMTPDLSSQAAFHHLGRFLGADKGTKGRGLGIFASALAGALDVGRNIASGYGYSKVNREMQDWYRKKIAERDRYYESDPQYDDVNTTGNLSFGKYGGMKKYGEGGSSVIRSIFDDRYKDYQNLNKRSDAIDAYHLWQQEVNTKAPKTWEEYDKLKNSSASFRKASMHLPRRVMKGGGIYELPNEAGTVYSLYDDSPVDNPYTVDIAPTPWGKDKSKGDKFRSWVNENHEDLAEKWNLDATGDPDNLYVRSAYEELKDEYERSQIPKRKLTVKQKLEQEEREKVVAKYGGMLDAYAKGGIKEYNTGGFSSLSDRASQLFNLALQANNLRNNQGLDTDLGTSKLNLNQTNMVDNTGMVETVNPNMDTAIDVNSEVVDTSSFQVGDPVVFEYGGKMVSGTVKKIENGKIYV
jgi:hypothetical protein